MLTCFINIVLISGTSYGGFGAEVAAALAHAHPKHIILAAQTQDKVSRVIEAIDKVNPAINVSFVEIDLLDNSSVRASAAKIKTLTDRIHILINCAGIMATKTYSLSEGKIESQFNHIGHFLWTGLLVFEILKAAEDESGAAIVNVASLGYQLGEVNFEDVNFQVRMPPSHF